MTGVIMKGENLDPKPAQEEATMKDYKYGYSAKGENHES